MLCHRNNLLQSIRLCPSGAGPPFMPVDRHNFASCAVFSEWHVECLPFSISFIYLFIFTFPFHHGIPFGDYLNCGSVHSPCNFLFLMWLSLQMLHPIIGPFIFRVLGFPYPTMAPGPVLCTRLILPYKNMRLGC